MTERFHYFSKRKSNEYPHDVFEHGPVHRKRSDRSYSLCGIGAFNGEGGSMWSTTENEDDKRITCVACRAMLGLSS